jgi:hypothetical protein
MQKDIHKQGICNYASILGEARWNSAEAERLCDENSPIAEHPVVILNRSCDLGCLYLFISLSTK